MINQTQQCTKKTPETIKTIQFSLATLSIHFYFVSYALSIVNIPSALAMQPDWIVGIVVGVHGLAGMISRPLIGVWVDSGKRETWVKIGGVATTIAFIGYGLSLDPWLMIPFRITHGIAMGAFTTGLLAIVASHIPEKQRGLGIGTYQGGNAIAQLYTPPIAVLIALNSSYEISFLLGACAAGLALFTGIFVLDKDPPILSKQNKTPWKKREWISKTALLPALVFVMMTTTVGATGAFLPLFSLERELGNPGLFYTVWGFTLLISRFSSGFMGDRYGRTKVILPALSSGALAFFILASAESQITMLLAGVIAGFALGSVQVSIMSIIIDNTPASSRGSAMATYTLAWDIGAVFGGILLGFIVNATSYSFGFYLVGILPILGIVLYVFSVQRSQLKIDRDKSRD